MNIDKIIKECPKAWEEWLKYGDIHNNTITDIHFTMNHIVFRYNSKLTTSHFRELYDYFDSVGIVVRVDFERQGDSTLFKRYIVQGWQKSDNGGTFCIATAKSVKLINAEFKSIEGIFEHRETLLDGYQYSPYISYSKYLPNTIAPDEKAFEIREQQLNKG